jgi:hypothetical protein
LIHYNQALMVLRPQEDIVLPWESKISIVVVVVVVTVVVVTVVVVVVVVQ